MNKPLDSSSKVVDIDAYYKQRDRAESWRKFALDMVGMLERLVVLLIREREWGGDE